MNFIFDPSLALYLPLYKRDGTSFMSDEAYGHLATVTGAIWTPQGRYFDGVDDYLRIPDAPSLDLTGEMTILAWMKRGATGAIWQDLVNKGASAYALGFSNNNKLSFTIGGVVEIISTGSAITSTSNFYQVGVVRSGTAGAWVSPVRAG